MPRGGKRPNPGPKKGAKYKGSLEKTALRHEYVRVQAAKFLEVMEAQHALATGVNVVGYRDKSGRFKLIESPEELAAAQTVGEVIRVYTRQPNAQAQTDLLNRLLDKPAEQEQLVRVTGEVELVQRLLNGRKRCED